MFEIELPKFLVLEKKILLMNLKSNNLFLDFGHRSENLLKKLCILRKTFLKWKKKI